MDDDLARWVVVDRTLSTEEVGGLVARIFGASHESGRVRYPAFLVTVADRQAAIASGLDAAALATWGTVLQLAPVSGTDEWSYHASVMRLWRGLRNQSLRADVAWGRRIGRAGMSAYEILRRLRDRRVDLQLELPERLIAPIPYRKLPFVIGIIGNFAGVGPSAPADLEERRFHSIDRDNFERVRAKNCPRLVDVPNAQCDVTDAAIVQQVAASWRDLRHLIANTHSSPMLQFMVCPVAKEELQADFARSPRLQDSWLFRRVCVDAFCSLEARQRPGSMFPFSVLVGGFDVAASDAALLGSISEVASAGLAPFVCVPGPWQTGTRTDAAQDEAWRRFADSPAARYVAWAMPKASVDVARPAGDVAGINPAFLVASEFAGMVDRFGWCAAIDRPDDARRVAAPGLGAVLCAARFGRHLACIIGDHAPELATRTALEAYLNRWLAGYVMSEDEANGVVRAARPLRAARVELVDAPMGQGFQATLSLRLGYQVDARQPPMRVTVPVEQGAPTPAR